MKSIHILNLLQIFLYSGFTFVISVLVFPKFIELITKFKFTQKIREDDVAGKSAKIFRALHLHKQGTPTMGGVVILSAALLTLFGSRVLSYFGVVDYSLLNRGETYLPVATMILVGILGLIDDYLNIKEKSAQKGLSARVKFLTILLFSVIGAAWFTFKLEYSLIHLPGIGDFELGLWYFPLFVFVILGTSNAVNFTDGLDGLAGGLLAIAYSVFAVIAYFFGLPILAVFCTIVVGALAGFLWFNVPPAKIYMGDTGALALGATLGVIAMMTNALSILVIVGFIFVLETLSVMLQLFWKRVFKRKLFLVAPIHHHFEAKGWSETQIVMRFWILGTIAGIGGLVIGIIGMGKGLI